MCCISVSDVNGWPICIACILVSLTWVLVFFFFLFKCKTKESVNLFGCYFTNLTQTRCWTIWCFVIVICFWKAQEHRFVVHILWNRADRSRLCGLMNASRSSHCVAMQTCSVHIILSWIIHWVCRNHCWYCQMKLKFFSFFN